MNFAPKELCEKLQAMGCVSMTDWYYKRMSTTDPNFFDLYYTPNEERSKWDDIICEAFTLEDFVGIHEQAKENARIVWGTSKEKMQCYDCPCCGYDGWFQPYEFHRHKMIDKNDPWEYLEKTMKGNKNENQKRN